MSERIVYDSPNDTSNIERRWWTVTGRDPANDMVGVAKILEERQKPRRRRAELYAQLYANQPLRNLYDLGTAKTPATIFSDPYGLGARVTYNVVQSCADTVAAKISKNRPRAQFLTTGGDYAMQRQAQDLTRWADGWYYACDGYANGQRAFLDSCIFENGLLKVYPDRENACVGMDRVLPIEVLVDDLESIYGYPRSLFHKQYRHRDVLLDQHGDKKTLDGREIRARIMDAAGSDPMEMRRSSEMVAVYEGWHLPSGRDATDGVKMLCIPGVTLDRQKYEFDWFPFPAMRWGLRPVGWWGQPMAEQLAPIQIEINRMMERARTSLRYGATPMIMAPLGSQINFAHFNNDPRIPILEFNSDKAPPQPFVSPVLPPVFWEQIERLYSRAFEVAGVSQLAANSLKPAGLDAAVAMREFHDIESERFVLPGQRFEQLHMDATKMGIAFSRQLYAGNVDVTVRAPGKGVIDKIQWSKVDLNAEAYIMQAFPTSFLPTTPAGRYQRIQEMVDGGFLDKDEARRLMDFPDLKSVTNLQNAGSEDAQRMVENIIEHGHYDPPEPYMNLGLLSRMAQSSWLRGRLDGVPEKRLDLLTRLIADVEDEMTKLTPPPAGQAPSPIVPTMAGPGAPPPPIGPLDQPGVPLAQLSGASPALPSELPA